MSAAEVMKKVQCKGIKLSFERLAENASESGVNCEKGDENEVDQYEIMHTMRGIDSLSVTHSNYADENTSCAIHTKKKEKFGLFKSIRRRFRSNFQRKSDDIDKSVEEITHISGSAKSKTDSKRQKQTSKCHLNLCSKPSNSNSSQSTESLDLNLQRKGDDNFWSNKDMKENGCRKEKPSCRSKDMSKFQTACNIPCTCEASLKQGADETDCRECVKISNVSPTFQINRMEISVLCHSNGITPGAATTVNYQDCKSTASDGAIMKDSPNRTVCPNGTISEAKTWSLTQELFRLSKFGWYWGPITRREAERKLNGQPDGAFLVRDSSDERYLLSLSFRSYGRTLHTRIEHCNGKFIFDAQPDTEGYPSIVDLIENSMNDPQTGICSYSRRGSPSPPIYPVRLTKPVSRFTQVRSLQYMCRFVIRQYTRYDHIQQLPLPKKLKGWIGENQY